MKHDSVAIFRIQLLPASETFIAAQASAMRRFSPFFVGWRRTAGIHIPEHRCWTVDNGSIRGKLRELRFRYMGPSRQDVARLRLRASGLVYAHFAPDGFAAMQLAAALDAPLVTALHGFDVTMNDQSMAKTRLGREYLGGRATLQKNGALFLACSHYVRQRALEAGYPAERTMVHAIGVDLQRFRPISSVRRQRLVLFVGRLVEKKGCSDLVNAMSEVQRVLPDAALVVIGEGPLRGSIEASAAARGVQCRFLGSQPENIVRRWMEQAAVFCVPSVVAASGDAEGLGMVFIEAQAMGVPVVSTRSGGIPEAVKHGETGLLVGERSPRSLAAAILALLQNDALWQTYSHAGRKYVEQHFDLCRQTDRLETIFEKVIDGRKAGPHPRTTRREAHEESSEQRLSAEARGGTT